MAGTATGGDDYDLLTGTISIPYTNLGGNGQIDINTLQDNLVEGDETVVLTIQPDASYTVGNPGQATVTIADNDVGEISLDLASPDYRPEGDLKQAR